MKVTRIESELRRDLASMRDQAFKHIEEIQSLREQLEVQRKGWVESDSQVSALSLQIADLERRAKVSEQASIRACDERNRAVDILHVHDQWLKTFQSIGGVR